MKNLCALALLSIGWVKPSKAIPALPETYHLSKVFSSPELRKKFSGFLDVVLQQIPSGKFFDYIDTLNCIHYPQSDAELYQKIQGNISSVQPRFSLYQQLKSLKNQKLALTQQAQQLMGDAKQVQGCLEIGQPATYINSMKRFLSVTGPVYVLNDSKGVIDYVKAGSLQPYTHFFDLNNYAPITKEMIPSNSLDLIVCFIGLHHIPQESLEAFIKSLQRILRPGGVFIVRDHDAHNDEVLSLASAAHSIFNIMIPGLSLEDELKEYRNFQPLTHWISLLEAHGFETDPLRLQQAGDPTLNTLLKFTKVARTEEEKYLQFSYQAQQDKEYSRDSIQTYLTTPEWLNVDVAQEYGKFIEHTPFYEFPYMENVKSYWHAFAQSWKAAARRKGHFSVLKSPYTLMNLFIGVTMSVEYGAKSLISWPMRLLYAGEETAMIKAIIEDPCDEVEALDSRIKTQMVSPNSHLKLVAIPRYKEFLKIIQRLALTTSIKMKEIAGQKAIQCKVRYHNNLHTVLDNVTGCTKEYSWTLPTQPHHTYAALTVQTELLHTVIKQLTQQGFEFLYIHDF